MNKWEKLLLLNPGPTATQTLSYLRKEELKKRISGATHACLINFSKKPTYNFLTFGMAGWS